MLKNHTILIPLGSPWTFHCELEKPTALVLSKSNKVIVFEERTSRTFFSVLKNRDEISKYIKDMKSLRENLVFFPSLNIVPLNRFSRIEKLNRYLNQVLLLLYTRTLKRPSIFWIFYPKHHYLTERIRTDIVIYDCVDFHSSIDEKDNTIRRNDDFILSSKADLIFVNSKPLHQTKRKFINKLHLVPQGFDFESSGHIQKSGEVKDIASIRKPIIGFVGNIDHRLDLNLLTKIAEIRKDWSFVFIGPQSEDPPQSVAINFGDRLSRFKRHENVFFLGNKEHNTIAKYIKSFDVGLIPYDVSQKFCKYCYPVKTFEYLINLVPVVSTCILALRGLSPYVRTCKNSQEMIENILHFLKNRDIDRQRVAITELAIANDWIRKLEKISESIYGFEEKTR